MWACRRPPHAPQPPPPPGALHASLRPQVLKSRAFAAKALLKKRRREGKTGADAVRPSTNAARVNGSTAPRRRPRVSRSVSMDNESTGKQLLEQRVAAMGLKTITMEDDGNCTAPSRAEPCPCCPSLFFPRCSFLVVLFLVVRSCHPPLPSLPLPSSPPGHPAAVAAPSPRPAAGSRVESSPCLLRWARLISRVCPSRPLKRGFVASVRCPHPCGCWCHGVLV